jgi:nucleotide-binding universal stress UspA family protein
MTRSRPTSPTLTAIPAQRTTEALSAAAAPAGMSGRRIVAGADGSYWGRAALRWAADHAWRVGAELEVHTAPAEPARADIAGDGLGQTARTFPMLPIRTRTSLDATSALVSASAHGEMVVLGCRGTDHGTTGLGSSVLPVARAAHCAVLVVRGRPDAVRGTHRSVTVLLADRNDDAVLREAAALAAARRCALRIQRAVPPAGRLAVADPVDRHMALLDRAARIARRASPRLRVSLHLMRSHPHEAVRSCADTDVLVVDGTTTADGALPLTTKAALHHAPCPVLAARRAMP